MDIPLELIKMAIEATSAHNDGWTKQGAIKQLKAWRDYINGVLEYTESEITPDAIERIYKKLEDEHGKTKKD